MLQRLVACDEIDNEDEVANAQDGTEANSARESSNNSNASGANAIVFRIIGMGCTTGRKDSNTGRSTLAGLESLSSTRTVDCGTGLGRLSRFISSCVSLAFVR